jgi:hypothetical protein
VSRDTSLCQTMSDGGGSEQLIRIENRRRVLNRTGEEITWLTVSATGPVLVLFGRGSMLPNPWAFLTVPGHSRVTDSRHRTVRRGHERTSRRAHLSSEGPRRSRCHPIFAHNVAPIYLPVYPVGSTVGTLNCQDTTATTVENCPDHGPLVAAAAQAIVGSVYGRGVLGHDHLVGIASTGGDFNILWEPVLVLFTNADAADGRNHVRTLAELNALVASGDVITIPAPNLTFHCSVVSAAVYQKGAPVA